VETYLKAVALHRTADVAPVVQAAGTYANQSTLDDLQTWFGRLPIGAVKMTAKPVKVPDAGSVGVRVSISARFSPAPLSNWVKLGDRVMLASYSEGAWRVVADISARKAVHTKAYGLRLFEVPSVLTGKHTTVIYEAVEAANDATQILSDADEVVPRLTGLFGTDRAAAHRSSSWSAAASRASSCPASRSSARSCGGPSSTASPTSSGRCGARATCWSGTEPSPTS
jgi:hypothetical protein